MGYTHYIEWAKLPSHLTLQDYQAALNQIGKYVQKILSVNDDGKRLIGPILLSENFFTQPNLLKSYELELLKAGKPIVWYDQDNTNVRAICFNGVKDNDDPDNSDNYEDFTIYREEFGTKKTNYTKTGKRNYDHVVVGCLTILNAFLPKIVRSDGIFNNWEPGVQALNKIMGTQYRNPVVIGAEMSYLDKLLMAAGPEEEKHTNAHAWAAQFGEENDDENDDENDVIHKTKQMKSC